MRNVGMYRVQVMDEMTAMHWHMHHDGARHFRKYQERGESACRWRSCSAANRSSPTRRPARCRPDVSELLFAGFLHGRGIELVPCKTIPLEVPANAEIVIEGWVDPSGDLGRPLRRPHRVLLAGRQVPGFDVTAITHRRDPIYPTTIVGLPPQEDYYLGKATERIFLPLLKMLIPDIIDYHLPMFGAFHNFVFVKIRKEYPMQARKVMSSIWGAGQMMFSKFIVVVDEMWTCTTSRRCCSAWGRTSIRGAT
jgi:4-hydroxy-3-polyprenylbenzoate decarboxylase